MENKNNKSKTNVKNTNTKKQTNNKKRNDNQQKNKKTNSNTHRKSNTNVQSKNKNTNVKNKKENITQNKDNKKVSVKELEKKLNESSSIEIKKTKNENKYIANRREQNELNKDIAKQVKERYKVKARISIEKPTEIKELEIKKETSIEIPKVKSEEKEIINIDENPKKAKQNEEKTENKKEELEETNKLKVIKEEKVTEEKKEHKSNTTLRILIFIIIILLIGLASYIGYSYYFKVNTIKNISFNDKNEYVIELESNDETYCYIGNNIDESNWIKAKNSKCIISYNNTGDYIYIKNKYGIKNKYDNKDIGKVSSLSINNELVYLAIGGTEKIDYSFKIIGKVNEDITFTSDDKNIATVNNDGVIKGVSVGETKVHVKYMDKIKDVKVVVTDKIITYGDSYDYNRSYLSCGMYTKEENDFLDEILKTRVKNAGYKTRAGAVAAARFLTLEFPYRISYFSENGRLHPYGVGARIDGEGRFYHTGLYLDESRYDIIETSMHGPATWGCNMYSFPSEGTRRNGFDCSGFISWIIHQAGFDNEDLGAGVSTIPDMTDLGDMYRLTDAVENKTIRTGDLLSGHGVDGGHIAMIAGIKDGKYYVAESLWYAAPINGALIKEYTPEELVGNFYWHVDMDKYYVDDGKYTEFWK